MLTFLNNYEYSIIIGIILGIAVGIGAYNFLKKSKETKISKVKQWLMYAVVKAEKEFGSKTGAIKLRFVYDLFLSKFPSVAKVISFEAFSKYVDEALETIKETIQTNKEETEEGEE
jgi:hypothetical protein